MANLQKVKLPTAKPDCCALCPLIGMIPKEQRQHGSYENLVCLGTLDALTKRGSQVRESKRDKKHPLHRPCDTNWELWQTLPKGELPISKDLYIQCRIPYELSQQTSIQFIKFHRRTK